MALAVVLPTTLAAQPCIQVSASSNWGARHNATRLTPTTVAVRVPGLAQTDTICQIEFYCFTYGSRPVNMPIWIYDRSPSGQPGSVIASGTMVVGRTLGSYFAPVQARVTANSDFFVAFDNAVGNLAPPSAGRGTIFTGASEHWHSGPPNWSGPFITARWMYRIYTSSGTVRGVFDTVGQGCAGSVGVPRIGNVGSPVVGSVFQVTLAGAPALAPVVHLLGTPTAPLALEPIGAAGCDLHVLPVVTELRRAGSTGATSYPYSIPNRRTMLGAELHVQWAVVDPGANPLGIIVSPGGVATIGDF